MTMLRYIGPPMTRGTEVVMVQQGLVKIALMQAADVDGLFGPQTAQAVRALQTAAGLPATGEVDAETARRLNVAAPIKPKTDIAGATPRPAPAATIKVVDPGLLPPARPKRIILHWTGGNARASEDDRQHYHFCIQQDGRVVPGRRSISDNDSTADGRYAAHTLLCNTGSVGIALCGMADAKEKPFRPGKVPIVAGQIPVLARLAAQVCQRYDIAVTPQTVLGHGEVQSLLKIAQEGKWDPMVLPWDTSLSQREVGDLLRAEVVKALAGARQATEISGDEAAGSFRLFMGSLEIPGGGIPENGDDWVPLAPLLAATGWTRNPDEDEEGDSTAEIANSALIRAGTVFGRVALRRSATGDLIQLADLVEELDLLLRIDSDGTRRVEGQPGGGAEPRGQDIYRRVTVARGQTLSDIARRYLGHAGEWRRILDASQRPFDETSARQLAAGVQVLVPVVDFAKTPAPKIQDAPAEALAAITELVAGITFPVNAAAARAATPVILAACLAEGITEPNQLGYVLATAEHETNFGRFMKEEWRSSEAQLNYQGRYGNTRPGDGQRFCGRGYVQITFRDNYRRFGEALGLPLEDQPELAEDPATAARLIAVGMGRIGFRGRRVLSDYGTGDSFDFYRARDIVNGDKHKVTGRYSINHGSFIAKRARLYAEAIRAKLA